MQGKGLAFQSAVTTVHGTMSLLTTSLLITTNGPGMWLTTVVRIPTTSANGGTSAGRYPCDGLVENLEPTRLTF